MDNLTTISVSRNIMKVLVIMGSPRKGNTERIVKEIENEVKKLGDVAFSFVDLRDSHLELCRGCHVCFFKGETSCPLKDDRAIIEEQLLQADGVIFASPNYVSNVPALFKNFIDRFAYAGHRPRFFHQRAMAIVTSAGPGGLSEACKYISASLGAFGFRFVHTAGFLQPPFPIPVSWRKENQEKVRTAARIFYSACESPRLPAPTLREVMSFRIMQLMLRKVVGTPLEKYYPSDCQYWKDHGWLDPTFYYFTGEDVGIGKKITIKVLEPVIGWQINKILKGSVSPAENQ